MQHQWDKEHVDIDGAEAWVLVGEEDLGQVEVMAGGFGRKNIYVETLHATSLRDFD